MSDPKPLPRVTVAICTYNRADFLRQTLTGMTIQNWPTNQLELLVIDNNSTDTTAAVVREFAHAPHVPRHVLETKQGLDHARNRGIAEATGEIIVLADDDILMEPDWVRQLAAPFMADAAKRIGCVGGEVVPVFPDGLPEWIREWHAPLAFRSDAGPLPPRDSPMGANIAFPKSVFARVGVFSTGLDRKGASLFGGGDGEMVRRIRSARYEIWFAPAAKVLHQMPASRTTFRYAARHAFDSARSRVADRATRPGAAGYYVSRFIGNSLKAFGFALLALANVIVARRDAAKKTLVRAWRSCGYLDQIPRSLCGFI
ncbi:MAG: glycosyltransferase [Opitutaceae bacterium]|nr:glycosyltransferase [Opitutaceae bacterium]